MNKPSLLLLQRTKYIYHLAICILWGTELPKIKKEKCYLVQLTFRMNIMNHRRSIFYDFACSEPGRKCDQTGPWCPSLPRPRAPSATHAAAASHGTNGGARVRRRPRAPSAMRAAAASHGTNGGDVKALTPSWSSCFSYSSDSALTATTVFRTTGTGILRFCPNIIMHFWLLKFIYSEKALKFCEISTVVVFVL